VRFASLIVATVLVFSMAIRDPALIHPSKDEMTPGKQGARCVLVIAKPGACHYRRGLKGLLWRINQGRVVLGNGVAMNTQVLCDKRGDRAL
jgi:hypothetical protein